MNSKNFSPGDVVVCVNDGPMLVVPHLTPCGASNLSRGSLYTVTSAFVSFDVLKVALAETSPAPAVGVRLTDPTPGYGSDRFRLAYTPDPEVERERTDEPIKHGADA